MAPLAPRFKVLVIEDEPLIAMMVEDTIQLMGCETVGPEAELGKALALVAAGQFDCAMLDINIRGGTSYGIAEILLGRGCPFLFTTGYSEWSLPPHLAGERMLAKPYLVSELERELRLLCGPGRAGQARSA